MDDQIARLQQALAEAERRASEAERHVLDERRRREDEQRRREEAEKLARVSQRLSLQEYLETCHSLHLSMAVVTDPSSSTKGEPTKPAGRIFPRRIVPWDDFAARQEEIWDKLSISPSFSSQRLFPSRHQLDYVKSVLFPISCEVGLRNIERDTVENAVVKLIGQAYDDTELRNHLDLQGTVTFESHTNLGDDEDAISGLMDRVLLDGQAVSASAAARRLPAPRPRRRARGMGTLADHFCIHKTSDGRSFAALAIEYKAPHKLTVAQLAKGLESEIQPERDVINKDADDFASASKRLAAAVITQLFSYMIGKGLQYGYVCTGEAFVFVRIPEDPSIAYFSLCVPGLDVMENDETRLHRTAVSQVFAFVLQALREDPPPEAWHDAAATLDTWAVEYDDVLKDIPETARKAPRTSAYKPQRWKGFTRSPIRTRDYCRQYPDTTQGRREDDDDQEDPPTPTPKSSRAPREATTSANKASRAAGPSRQTRSQKPQQDGQKTKPAIQSRPYCTQQCLRGLAFGGAMDKSCPNAHDHGRQHLGRLEFLGLVRAQLATDRGRDADCAPLHLSGARGSLFKVRLSSHGYTLAAKGVEGMDRGLLQHENTIYNRLQPIQGLHVPVCLGTVDLVLPYYYDCGVYMHFMFLSWAGRPLADCVGRAGAAAMVEGVAAAMREMHRLHVLHRDAEPRNIVCDPVTGAVMVVDFERAEFRGECRPPLGTISPNRKRKRRGQVKEAEDEDDGAFVKEMRGATSSVERFVAALEARR